MANRNTSLTDRIGVNYLEKVLLNDFGWIYRDQPIVDIGLDGIIEVANEDSIQELLIAGVQIKTGKGNFKEHNEFYRYYASERHFKYWSESAMPILMIAVFPGDSIILYEFATKENFTKKEKSYAIDINKKRVFDVSIKIELIDDIINHYDSFQYRFDQLDDADDLSGIEYTYLIREKFSEIKESIYAVATVMKNYRKVTKRTEKNIDYLNANDVSHESSKGKRLIKKMGLEMDQFRRRLAVENRESERLFKDGIYLYLQYTDIYLDYQGRNETSYNLVLPYLQDLLDATIEGRKIPLEMYNTFDSTTQIIRKLTPQLRKSVKGLLKEYQKSIKSYEEYQSTVSEYIKKCR